MAVYSPVAVHVRVCNIEAGVCVEECLFVGRRYITPEHCKVVGADIVFIGDMTVPDRRGSADPDGDSHNITLGDRAKCVARARTVPLVNRERRVHRHPGLSCVKARALLGRVPARGPYRNSPGKVNGRVNSPEKGAGSLIPKETAARKCRGAEPLLTVDRNGLQPHGQRARMGAVWIKQNDFTGIYRPRIVGSRPRRQGNGIQPFL
jgi:hypothetical protein